MTEAERLAERLRELLAKATPGPWGIWFEQIDGKADRAIQELVEQVHATNPIGNSLVMLDADGKCPAITGCGPTSVANAALIVEAVNALPTLLARIAALEEALRAIEEGTIERPVGSSYRTDGKPSKHDCCIHNVWMYQTCEGCIDAHIAKALGKEETT